MTRAQLARVTVNPSDDDEFLRLVERLAHEVSGARALEQRLRERYPAAIVMPTLLADEPVPALYVYRDGQWSPGGTSSVLTSELGPDDAVGGSA